MGHDCGDFFDNWHDRPLHVEARKGQIYIWTTPEMTPVLRMTQEEAAKLWGHLKFALEYYYDYKL